MPGWSSVLFACTAVGCIMTFDAVCIRDDEKEARWMQRINVSGHAVQHKGWAKNWHPFGIWVSSLVRSIVFVFFLSIRVLFSLNDVVFVCRCKQEEVAVVGLANDERRMVDSPSGNTAMGFWKNYEHVFSKWAHLNCEWQMLNLFKQYKYLVFCSLYMALYSRSWKGWHFLSNRHISDMCLFIALVLTRISAQGQGQGLCLQDKCQDNG